MSFLKAIGRLFEGEKPEQSNPVKVNPTSLDNKVNKRAYIVSKTNKSLVDELNMCRVSIARREGIKPYMVFTDRQLSAILDAKPISERELSWIEGFDEEKAFKYGKEISDIFRYW